MKRKIIYSALAVCAAFTGCVNDDGLKEKEFISGRNEISLSIDNHEIMRYNDGSHQLAFNDEKNEFRVYNDSFSNYFVLTCSSMPSTAGETIKAVLTYTNNRNKVICETGTFKVSKINEDDGRMIWMWNQDKHIGVVVKVLQ